MWSNDRFGFKTQNSYKIEILTNPAYIEDEEIYAIKQKRKMKKVILILLIALGYLNVSFAQKSKQLIYKNQLLGTAWIQKDGENLYQISFDDNCIISKYIRNGKIVAEHHKKYYLDKKPLTDYNTSLFESDKVGNSEEGMYIVFKFESQLVTYIDFYTIEKMDENELVLFHKAKPKSIGGRDIIITLTRHK